MKNQNQCRVCGGNGKPSKAILNLHNIQTLDHSKEFEDKMIDCLKCEDCGHSWVPIEELKTIRQQALEWWNSLPLLIKGSKHHYSDRYYPNRGYNNLTGREIEEIWKKETQIAYCEKTTCNNSECKTNCKELKYKERPNQKQFKEFNAELFKAYINKFNEDDRVRAFDILIHEMKNQGFTREEIQSNVYFTLINKE